MKFPVLALALALIYTGQLYAEAEHESVRKVRFLAVGELPPFRQAVRDGVRYELEPPAGSIPPREVLVGIEGGEPKATPLNLGRISEPLKAPAGIGPLLLKRRDAAHDAAPWLQLTCPESGDFLVVLWRDPKSSSWDKARSIVLPDDSLNSPSGGVQIINISPATVGITIGSEKLVLSAGKILRRKVTQGGEEAFQILLTDTSGSLRPLYSGVITQNPGERSMVLVYRADGESQRRPLKVSVLREPTPPLPQPEKK